MTDISVGDKVLLPDGNSGTVEHLGKRLVTVRLDNPPYNWKARGLSDQNRYSYGRLTKV